MSAPESTGDKRKRTTADSSMADDLSPAEVMRRKRLARFQGGGAAGATEDGESPPAQPTAESTVRSDCASLVSSGGAQLVSSDAPQPPSGQQAVGDETVADMDTVEDACQTVGIQDVPQGPTADDVGCESGQLDVDTSGTADSGLKVRASAFMMVAPGYARILFDPTKDGQTQGGTPTGATLAADDAGSSAAEGAGAAELREAEGNVTDLGAVVDSEPELTPEQAAAFEREREAERLKKIAEEAVMRKKREREHREKMLRRREEQQQQLKLQRERHAASEPELPAAVPTDSSHTPSPSQPVSFTARDAARKATAAVPTPSQPISIPQPMGLSPRSTNDLSMATPGHTPESQAMKAPDPRPAVEWTHHFLVKVFHVSVLKTLAELAQENKQMGAVTDWRGVSQVIDLDSVLFLPQIAKALPDNHSPEDVLNDVLHARLSACLEHKELPDAMSYLIGAFQRAHDESKTLSKKSRLQEVTERSLELIANYTMTCLQVPDLYSDNGDDVRSAWFNSLVDETFPQELLQRLIARCEQDGHIVLTEIMQPVLACLSGAVGGADKLTDAWPFVSLLGRLSQFPSVCLLILEHDRLVPEAGCGRTFEIESLLGPFFRPSSIPSPAEPGIAVFDGESYFSSDLSPSQRASARDSIRTQLELIRKTLFETCRNLLRVKQHRDNVLLFVGTALKLNQKRAQLRADRQVLSSDGFMLNLTSVLLRLCRPFVKFSEPPFSKIDPMFFCNTSEIVDTSLETRLGCGAEEVEKWRCEHAAHFEQPPNFVTHAFFYTQHALHVGLVPCLQKFTHEWFQTREQLRQAIAVAEQMGDPRVSLLREQMKRFEAHTLCHDAELVDPALLKEALEFYCFSAAWLLHVAGNGDCQSLPETPPIGFAVLPEYFVEDICELMIFLSRFKVEVIEECLVTSHLVHFVLAFIGRRDFVTNPYLRGKLVEVIALYSPGRRESTTKFFDQLRSDRLAVQHLGPALMQFYVDAEDTDFYVKLNMRSNAQIVLQDLWQARTSREGIVQATKHQGFLRFIMFLLNDTTYLLDEAREALETIQGLKEQQRSPSFSPASADGREVSTSLHRAEGQARGLLRLVNETLHMFEYITEEVVDPFLSCEVIHRLAGMLNLNVKVLVDAKSSKIIVSEAEQYGYNPSNILKALVTIYLHVSMIDHHGCSKQNMAFVEAIAADDRSYRKDIFQRVVHVLSLPASATQIGFAKETVVAFQHLAESVESAAQRRRTEDEELGEVPDQYLDQILYEIMTDPVQLPESKAVVDRQTIAAHLLSDPHDPFNRQPLDIKDVIPLPDLKAEIERFKADRHN